jgi:hypothetical protein
MTIYEVEETDFDDGFEYMVAENRSRGAIAKPPSVVVARGKLVFKPAAPVAERKAPAPLTARSLFGRAVDAYRPGPAPNKQRAR